MFENSNVLYCTISIFENLDLSVELEAGGFEGDYHTFDSLYPLPYTPAMEKSAEIEHTPDRVKRGFIEVPGGRVWYRAYGVPSELPPVLTLHGGPGYPHPDLYPVVDLYRKFDQPVILYDQLGAGFSDRPKNPELWNVDRFVEEIGVVTQSLKEELG